jgi:hypothetical protein
MKNPKVIQSEIAAIISGMPLGVVASFTYQGNPTRLLLTEMTEDAQLHALRILAKCREIDLDIKS